MKTPEPGLSKVRGRPSDQNAGGYTGQDDLARALSEVARSLQAQDDVSDTFDAIVAAAVDTIPGAECGGITEVRERHEISVRYASDPLVAEVDMLQYKTGQGPCLDAAYIHRTVRIDDMQAEERWPEFASRAAERGVGSMLAFQLYVTGNDLGALNLYSRRPRSFTDESEHVGLLFSAHAAVAVVGAQHEDQLQSALTARDVIGQAKGVLMERHKITATQAFNVITKVSQDLNIKVGDLAAQVAETGSLPEE